MKITRTKITSAVSYSEEGFKDWLQKKKGVDISTLTPAKLEELGTRFFPTYRSECLKANDKKSGWAGYH